MYTEFSSLFQRIFAQNHLEKFTDEPTVQQFYRLTEIMLETNRVMNVTALTTLDKIIPLHYADCAMIADDIPAGAHVADVGCGGGFPSLPLAILRPDLHITAIDSTEKKVKYVAETAAALNIHITPVVGRAEALANDVAMRESFDMVVSRAVARLNVLDELCLPFLKIGGTFLSMKGAAGREELAEAQHGISLLGGGYAQLKSYPLYVTQGAENRTLITIPKERATPKPYPRAFAKIKKNPL